jgi:nucleotidyltransferase/DNA polymerase involved in DNA repair
MYKLRLISAQVHGDDVLGDARLASAARLCDRLRQATKRELNLETSAGVSTSKLLAKTVAGLHKPFQQTVLADTPENRRLVLPDDLPLRKVYGIGHSTAQQLASAGVATVGDLRDFSGPSSISDIERLRALARGDDASLVKQTGAPKSIGAEESFWTKPLAVPSERADDALKMLARKLVRKLAVDQKAHGARPFENVQLSARRAAERSGSPRALTSTLAEGPASAQREKTPGREAKSRPARARVGTLTDDAACEALASKLEADAAALLTALYPHGATLSILNLGVTLKTIDAAGHADISSFLTKRKAPAPAPRPAPPAPTPPAPASPAAASTGIDGAEVDPQTLSELPPEIRADIERQLALWRKTRRPPAKKPRHSSSGMDAFLSPPPPPAVDDAAVAQIVAMGFSRKSAVAALERVNGDVQRAIDGLLASS